MFTLFFVSPEILKEREISLTGPQAHHALSVLRVHNGEMIRLADGIGNWIDGEITELSKNSLTVQVRERGADPAARTQITIAQAILKGENQKAALDQLVQAGVDAILPWQAHRSVAAIDKSQKWHEVMIAAARQSRRAQIPTLLPKSDLEVLIATSSEYDYAIALHESGTTLLSEHSEIATADRILVIVGPEGGLSEQEIAQLEKASIPTVKLGDAVLRADLAGAVALGAIRILTREW